MSGWPSTTTVAGAGCSCRPRSGRSTRDGGYGGELARGALDDTRASGRSVVPLYPSIAGWFDRHDDYRDLVDADALAYLDA